MTRRPTAWPPTVAEQTHRLYVQALRTDDWLRHQPLPKTDPVRALRLAYLLCASMRRVDRRRAAMDLTRAA